MACCRRSWLAANQRQAPKEAEVFFELRQYRVKEGRRDDWVRFMEEEIIPFQIAKGMVVVGSFTCPEQPDLYVWLRRFESEEERKQLYAAVYESEHWKNDLAPRCEEMLYRDKIVVTLLEPTAKSVIR
jgi:hypothetical protein